MISTKEVLSCGCLRYLGDKPELVFCAYHKKKYAEETEAEILMFGTELLFCGDDGDSEPIKRKANHVRRALLKRILLFPLLLGAMTFAIILILPLALPYLLIRGAWDAASEI